MRRLREQQALADQVRRCSVFSGVRLGEHLRLCPAAAFTSPEAPSRPKPRRQMDAEEEARQAAARRRS